MFTELQIKIVKELVSSLNINWDKISLNHEIMFINGEFVVSPDFRSFQNGTYEQHSISIEADDLLDKNERVGF